MPNLLLKNTIEKVTKAFEVNFKGFFVCKINGIKKAPRVEASQRLYFQCGEYRNRTDDLLTASQTL